MLRPGFSLAGMVGRVISSEANAPPGTVAVWMEWEENGYTETDDLPSKVNVPAQWVEAIEPPQPDTQPHSPQSDPPPPGLRIVP
jgi:hypothetical protein